MARRVGSAAVQAASVATVHCDRSARRAIASESATDAMLAGTDTRNAPRHGKEGRRRLFLPSTAQLAHVGSAALSWLPIER